MDTQAITWKPEYSVGHSEIDQQHQYLFELCRSFAVISTMSENRLSMEQALLALLDYVDLHFDSEEKYYRHHPEYENHHQMHQEFIAKAREFEARFRSHDLEPAEVLNFLTQWLVNHIVHTDIRFFNDIQSS